MIRTLPDILELGRNGTKDTTMTREEVTLLIEQTAFRVAETVCERYAKERRADLSAMEERLTHGLAMHVESCPGRRVGRLSLVLASIMSSAATAIVIFFAQHVFVHRP